MSKMVFEEKIEEKGYQISILCIRLANGIIIIVTDTTYKIGTIAMAIPSRIPEISKRAVSSLLTAFDMKGEVVARAIAERLATELGMAVLAIVNLKEKSLDRYKTVVKGVNNLIKKIKGL
ncbi:MAG: hypothetical protein ACTSV7_02020 [Candidatus Baldrarchaeia archaeon]